MQIFRFTGSLLDAIQHYMLQNKDGRGQRVPRGQSWQWIHAVQDLDQLTSVLQWLAQRVHVDQLELINVYLDHVAITDSRHADLVFEAKSKICYSKITTPHRVIDMSEHPAMENALQKMRTA
jgi:hypothetical protein